MPKLLAASRPVVIVLICAAGALILALVLTLAVIDLSRYRDRVEARVAQQIGRSFAIDGGFQLRVLPSLVLRAERVRVGNAAWGSAPQMLEIGRVAADIGLTSLVRGPVEIRALELSDVSLVLERGRDGRGNWLLGAPGAEPPALVRGGTLDNARIAFREAGRPERVVLIEALTLESSASAIELRAAVLDLTPLLAGARGSEAQAEPAAKRLVFDEAPLPFPEPSRRDTRLRVAVAELRLGAGSLKDVEATLLARDGRLTLDARAKGGVSGALEGTLTIAPADKGRAEANLKLVARDLRTGVEAGDALEPREAPATSLQAELRATGASARELASSASGRVLLTQGSGKVESGVVGLLGGDVLARLAGKLNPFSAQDPYSQLHCSVVRADMVDGRARLDPVLFQTEKVSVTAQGEIDLRTEKLKLSFATHPRKGIGISPGMFTNRFLDLGGTLADPSLGVGARAAASGAAAAVTGGASVLAQGLLDRLRGAEDRCKEVLEAAAAGR